MLVVVGLVCCITLELIGIGLLEDRMKDLLFCVGIGVGVGVWCMCVHCWCVQAAHLKLQ